MNNKTDIEEDIIAKAKERISKSLNDVLYSTLYSQEENEEDEKILLAYIKRLESKVEEAYYNGYIQKQNEAIQICKICKYKAKANKYDSLVEKMKEKIAGINKEIEKYREYTEQGIETDIEWVDNVADRQTVKVLQELLDTEK